MGNDMELFIYFLGASFLLLGSFIIFSNYVRQITNFSNRHKENAKWSSPTPLVGPMFIIIGYTILPFEFSNLIFLVLILDPDTLIAILSIPYIIKGLFT